MKTLVVYDSQFGNTKKIALAIAETLQTQALLCSKVDKKTLRNLKFLIVGCPTQGGRSTLAMDKFLKLVPTDTAVAVFDTRFEEKAQKLGLKLLMKTIGYAGPKIAAELTAKGTKLIGSVQGFIVIDKEGPLKSGEIARAKVWAEKLQTSLC